MKIILMGSSLFPQWRYRQFRNRAEYFRKKGWSYKQILNKIPVSKSTISLWCRDIFLTKGQIAELGSRYDIQLRGAKANQRKSIERKEIVRHQALSEISSLSYDALKIAGAMLYWAEGNKKNGTAIANSDPVFVVFFVKWLHEILNISTDRLTPYLHLHQGQNEQKEKIFWSKLTGIPLHRFKKSFYKPVGTGYRKNILYHGTIKIHIRGPGVELLRHRILGWAEGVAKYFVPDKVIKLHYRGRVGW